MAPKRPSPLDEPPSASTSSLENEEEAQSEEEVNDEGSEEEEDSENEEEEEENDKPSAQKPNAAVAQQPQASSETEGSDSDCDSPTASAFTIKPIVSKPMKEKSTPKPSVPVSKPATKRPAENEQNGKEAKKKTKVANGDDEDGALEEKKSAIHRLWSEDDEIVILEGMIDYQTNKGTDPYAEMAAFHEFIKKSLHVDVSKNQLMDKVRRLRKKYHNNAEKGENGEDPVFSKPHEHKTFELSKKIWGSGATKIVDDSVKSNNKKGRKGVKVDNSLPPPKEDSQDVPLREMLNGEVRDIKVDKEDFWAMHPRLENSMELEKKSVLSLSDAGKKFLKEGVCMIGNEKAKQLEEKWTNYRMEEAALYLKRLELIREQTELVLAAMKSPNH